MEPTEVWTLEYGLFSPCGYALPSSHIQRLRPVARVKDLGKISWKRLKKWLGRDTGSLCPQPGLPFLILQTLWSLGSRPPARHHDCTAGLLCLAVSLTYCSPRPPSLILASCPDLLLLTSPWCPECSHLLPVLTLCWDETLDFPSFVSYSCASCPEPCKLTSPTATVISV